MALLEVRNLYKQLGGKQILQDISFELEKGKTLSIIGSSGSGKTTLLRCLNFLETADEGEIWLKGERIYGGSDEQIQEKQLKEIRRHFGLVFQQFNLFPQYTVLENVLLAPRLAGKQDLAKARELLSMMGLSERADYYPHQLSGGQQQRCAIARALAMDPDILCFDEPTSALDPLLTSEVLKVISELALKKTTMIVVTHEIGFAREISDQVIFMDEGMIVESGTARGVIDDPEDERTRAFLSSVVRY